MALLFIDSFDHYTSLTTKYNTLTCSGSGCTVTIDASTGRFGSGLRLWNPNSGGGEVNKILPSTYSTIIVGFAFRFTATQTASPTLVIFKEGSTSHVDVRLDDTHRLYVTRNGTTIASPAGNPLTLNTWNYLEFKATIHDTTGSVEVKVNGISTVSASNVDTRNGGTGLLSTVTLGGSGRSSDGGTAGFQYDDIYICDTSGTTNNDFLGDVRVEAIFPSGAGNTANFTPSTGSNYENVDEATPDDDTTYNYSSTAGHVDTFAFGNVTPTAGTVYGVQQILYARKDDAGSRSIRPVVRHSGTDYDTGTSTSIGNSYAINLFVIEQNPGTSAAWTISDVNNAEFGYKLVS